MRGALCAAHPRATEHRGMSVELYHLMFYESAARWWEPIGWSGIGAALGYVAAPVCAAPARRRPGGRVITMRIKKTYLHYQNPRLRLVGDLFLCYRTE